MCRGDIAGALEVVLTDAPYGPNVDEAKVRSPPPPCSLHLSLFHHVHPSNSLMLHLNASQNLNLQTLVTILNSTKATEIPGVIKSLSQDSQDTLMKYLYKGMALPGWGDVSGSVLLGWHEKVRFYVDFESE